MTRSASVPPAVPSQGLLALGVLLLAVNAAPPYQGGQREVMFLLLTAGMLLEILSQRASELRLGSGWFALAWATGYPGLGAPWLLSLALALQMGVSWLRNKSPRRCGRALTHISPVLAGVAALHFLPLPKAMLLAVPLCLALTLAVYPDEPRSTLVRRNAEEWLWFGALLWISPHGIWALAAAATLLVAVYSQQEVAEPDLKQSLSRQMSTTENTLRASQKRFQEDEGRYQSLLSTAEKLDEFQLRALQVDHEKALCDLLMEAVAQADKGCQAGICLVCEGQPNRQLRASHGFQLADFEPLPTGWRTGQALRSPCGTRSFYALNSELIFLRRSGPQAEEKDEVVNQLLGRARLIVRILEQKRELAGLLQEKTQALQQLAESQDQLVQSEKLASIGQLAAGVAHEINSPLAAIQLQAQLGRKRLAKNDTEGVIRSFETCVMASQKAKTIIESLLTFAQFSDGTREPIRLGDVLAQSLRMLEGHFENSAVEVRVQLPELPPLVGNAQEIGQILTNILVNAVDALSERSAGRRIMISATASPTEQRLTLANNGPAIPEEALEKLFDPFFTTKEIGKGTGLGLSLAYQLAKGHGGGITPSNQDGWVHFTLTLPSRL